MIVHQDITKYIIESGEEFKDTIDNSHRQMMLFDSDDESFFEWLAFKEKNGISLNHYCEQRKLLEWSFYSLIHSLSHYKVLTNKETNNFANWGGQNGLISIVEYYLDNAVFRIHAILERIYSFCDIWFELGLSKEDGRLYNSDKLFKESIINNNQIWKASKILKELQIVRAKYKNGVEKFRHDLTHNLDPREYQIEYDKINLHVSIPKPTYKTDFESINEVNDIIKSLFFLRKLQAEELSKNMSKNNVKNIDMMDYYTMRDSPLF